MVVCLQLIIPWLVRVLHVLDISEYSLSALTCASSVSPFSVWRCLLGHEVKVQQVLCYSLAEDMIVVRILIKLNQATYILFSRCFLSNRGHEQTYTFRCLISYSFSRLQVEMTVNGGDERELSSQWHMGYCSSQKTHSSPGASVPILKPPFDRSDVANIHIHYHCGCHSIAASMIH